jgi:hypothetical protein
MEGGLQRCTHPCPSKGGEGRGGERIFIARIYGINGFISVTQSVNSDNPCYKYKVAKVHPPPPPPKRGAQRNNLSGFASWRPTGSVTLR